MPVFPEIQSKINTILGAGAMAPARFCSVEAPFLIAIDGRCASGKSTLAEALVPALRDRFGVPVNLFHMDDFFLRPEQRTAQRYLEPGGNVDRERFLEQVLLPLGSGGPFCYRPFDCRSMTLSSPVAVQPAPLAVIEGSYSCHPLLFPHYDLRIFMTISPEKQRERLLARGGEEGLKMFLGRWIPLEERYFGHCGIEAKCDLVLNA